jgi:hypothetical protein
MIARARLPNRRQSETLDFEHLDALLGLGAAQ